VQGATAERPAGRSRVAGVDAAAAELGVALVGRAGVAVVAVLDLAELRAAVAAQGVPAVARLGELDDPVAAGRTRHETGRRARGGRSDAARDSSSGRWRCTRRAPCGWARE